MKERVSPSLSRSFRTLWQVSALVLLAACVADPVEWGNVAYRSSRPDDPGAPGAVMSEGLPAIPGTVTSCLTSIRTAGDSSDVFRVWWSVRSDSSVVLAVQKSATRGSTWGSAMAVESWDRGRRGCRRPAPGIAYDPPSGYVYLVYFVEPSDGAGVFFVHSMDEGGMFHAPVPVVYGEAPSKAGVAGRGDSVVVVFEDPNSAAPRIGMAASRTTGHLFEQRAEVTPDGVPAVAPWVALNRNRITVWWQTPTTGSRSLDQVGYREGVWK